MKAGTIQSSMQTIFTGLDELVTSKTSNNINGLFSIPLRALLCLNVSFFSVKLMYNKIDAKYSVQLKFFIIT